MSPVCESDLHVLGLCFLLSSFLLIYLLHAGNGIMDVQGFGMRALVGGKGGMCEWRG